jgi:hypothetical protein
VGRMKPSKNSCDDSMDLSIGRVLLMAYPLPLLLLF